jgi:hypothetical protein
MRAFRLRRYGHALNNAHSADPEQDIRSNHTIRMPALALTLRLRSLHPRPDNARRSARSRILPTA